MSPAHGGRSRARFRWGKRRDRGWGSSRAGVNSIRDTVLALWEKRHLVDLLPAIVRSTGVVCRAEV